MPLKKFFRSLVIYLHGRKLIRHPIIILQLPFKLRGHTSICFSPLHPNLPEARWIQGQLQNRNARKHPIQGADSPRPKRPPTRMAIKKGNKRARLTRSRGQQKLFSCFCLYYLPPGDKKSRSLAWAVSSKSASPRK